ncbi:receptor-type tyrosine-protein phosphatase epsilon-like [Clytia hemisphaerica]|uniref:protein-tyrosine-phosphatase n=1 Tax=Clytia hemisphaerica TaxID=252671 RepID=A0A7M5X1F9_9CNID
MNLNLLVFVFLGIVLALGADNYQIVLVQKKDSFKVSCNYDKYQLSKNLTFPSLNLTKDGIPIISILFTNESYEKKLFDERFEWTGDDKTLSFVLKSLESADSGDYVCVSKDGNNIVTKSEVTKLTVLIPPILALQPPNTNLDIFKGDFVNIRCKVTPQPLENLTISWTLGNNVFTRDTFNERIYEMNRLTCSAKNRAGVSAKTVFITVKAPEPSVVLNFRYTKSPPSKSKQSYTLYWNESNKIGKSFITHYQIYLDHVFHANVSKDFELKHLIPDLNIFHQHSFSISACNVHGCSAFERIDSEATPFLNLTSRYITSSSLKIDFTANKNLNQVTYDQICITMVTRCDDEKQCKQVVNDSHTEVEFKSLKPYCLYSFVGYYKTLTDPKTITTPIIDVSTSPAAPDGVEDMNVVYDNNFSLMQLFWKKPTKLNDKRVNYSVSYVPYNEPDHFQPTNLYSDFADPTTAREYEHILTGLKASTIYLIKVKASNSVGYNIVEIVRETDEKTPSAPTNLKAISSTDTTITIQWDFETSVNRYRIRYEEDSEKNLDFIDTPTNERILTGLKAGRNYSVSVSAITIKRRTQEELFGPPATRWIQTALKPGTQMKEERSLLIAVICVMVFLVLSSILFAFCYCHRKSLGVGGTSKFYLDSPEGVISTPFTFGLKMSLRRAETSKRQPMTLEEFEKHVAELHANTDYLFSEEYASLGPNHPEKNEVTYENSKTEANRLKNRYPDIVAYDQSRVRLMSLEGVVGSNYINANYVDGYNSPAQFIATQAPLTHTVSDFWRMCWERKSHIIVMLTNLFERGRKKCDQYWPNSGKESYKNYDVTLIETSQYANYSIRKLKLVRTSITADERRRGATEKVSDGTEGPEERMIFQYHFEEWPDFGTPNDRGSVISFILHCREHEETHPGPPIIHCSAGVGRTGTYIMLDSLMRRFDHTKDVEVFSSLKKLRKQRNYLVQQECQYIFVHDTILDYMMSGSTLIPVETLEETVNSKEFFQQIDHQWNILEKQKISPHLQVLCHRPYNTNKNRDHNVVPVDSHRVRISVRSAIEGTDYINASFFDSYHHRNSYIVTQHPLTNTLEDFWRMIWEHNSLIVINLTQHEECQEGDYPDYIPIESEQTFGHFHLRIDEERIENNYTCRKITLRNDETREDQYNSNERQIYHYHFKEWATDFYPRNAFLFELLTDVVQCQSKVRNWYPRRRSFVQNRDPEPPITIHCSCGSGRSAIFALLLSFKEQLESSYRFVDVYSTVKSMMTRRPFLLQNKGQYEFLHKALLALKVYLNTKPRSNTLELEL